MKKGNQKGQGSSKTSASSSDPQNEENKGKTWQERLTSDEIGIKLLEDPPPQQPKGPPVLPKTSSSNNSNYNGARSKSPGAGMHRVQVYEAKRRKSCKELSPYLCEIARRNDPRTAFKEIYVSDAEFRLIQHALNLQTAAKRRAMNIRKTLFGYVYVQQTDPPERHSSGPQQGPSSGVATNSHQSTGKSSTSIRKSASHTAVLAKSPTKLKTDVGSISGKQRQGSSGLRSMNKKTSLRFYKGKKGGNRSVTSVKKLSSQASNLSQELKDGNESQWAKVNDGIRKLMISASSSPFETSKETLTDLQQTDSNFRCFTGRGVTNSSETDTNFRCFNGLGVTTASETDSNLRGFNGTGVTKSADGNIRIFTGSGVTSSCETDGNIRIVSGTGVANACETDDSSLEPPEFQSFRRPIPNVDSSTEFDMKIALFAAAETSMILMNTLFKDSMDDPSSSQQVTESTLFREFIDVETERDALEKAAALFEAAAKAIQSHLNRTKDNAASESEQSIGGGKATVKVDAEGQEVVPTLEANDGDGDVLMRDESGSVAIEGDEYCSRPQWDYCTDFAKKPFHVTVASSSVPGFLLQTIMCKDYEFHLQYIGNTRKVSTLISSSASKSKAFSLTPYQLIDIIDRSFSATAARLTASKYHLQLASQNLGTVVQEYMEGKYGHYSKTIKKSNAKLQGLNTFAGIILQMSRVMSNVFRALLLSTNIYAQLKQLLQSSKVQDDNSINDRTSSITVGPSTSTLEELITFISEIENAIEIGKTSLAAVYSPKTNADMKMKRFCKKIIENVFESVTQLQTHHDKDFAALVISGICSSSMLLNCKETLPVFPSALRRNALTSVTGIEGNLRDLNGISHRMIFVSGYLASKSLQNLRNNHETLKMQAERKTLALPWYKRRFFLKNLERPYSRISIPSPERIRLEDLAVYNTFHREGSSGDEDSGNKAGRGTAGPTTHEPLFS